MKFWPLVCAFKFINVVGDFHIFAGLHFTNESKLRIYTIPSAADNIGVSAYLPIILLKHQAKYINAIIFKTFDLHP